MGKIQRVPAAKPDVYELINAKILAALEAGTVPWVKPWTVGAGADGLPRSLSSGKRYQGVNVLLLGLTAFTEDYGSPYWGTYGQIQSLGGQVRKGQKSTAVTLWKRFTKVVDGEDKSFSILRYFSVFNADQADWPEGLPKRFAPAVPVAGEAFDPIEEAEAIVAAYFNGPGPALVFKAGGDRAFYRPGTDTVTVPERSGFKTPAAFYSTLFHEAGHSTGHESRLGREGIGHKFGSEAYGKEELVAELTAAFVLGAAGIEAEAETEQSAAYLANWIKAIKGDKKLLVSAAAAAQKAANLIIGEAADVVADDETEKAVAA